MNGLNCESKLKKFYKYFAVSIISVLITLIAVAGIVYSSPAVLDVLLYDYYIDRYYYGEVDSKDITDGALLGITDGLEDKYALYLNSDDSEERTDRLNGTAKGLGINVTKYPGSENIYVRNVYADSPAEKAGLLQGDIIVSVDGDSVSLLGYSSAVSSIQREIGQTVLLGIQRDSEVISLTAEYSDITVQTVFYERIGDLAYIEIVSFNGSTPRQFKESVEKAISESVKGLIFDLRGNGGGTLSSVGEMLDFLLPEGDLVTAKYKDGKTEVLVSSDSSEIDIPMAVLTDHNTASAAEIFASNIREFGKGMLFGSKTYGKGIMQNTYSLSGGRSVVFTVAEVFTHGMTAYHGEGLAPDTEITLTEEEQKNFYITDIKQDRVVLAAVESLGGEVE